MLDVQNLVRRFGKAVGVDGASLDAAAGEVVALLGPSGCGKTTTLRIIAGFERADSGHVRLEGADVMRLPPHARDIGLVFQDYALFPHMTVADNLAYGLRRRGWDRARRADRIREILSLVRLEGLEGRRPAQLSGGQQQRVALGRALAFRPKLLLLDEPLSNLDAKLRETLQVELRALLREAGTTTLVVTHDQDEALALADRIAVMAGGRVLQQGTPRDLYEEPASRFVATFLGRSLWLAGEYRDGRFVTAGGSVLPAPPPRLRAGRYGLLLRPEALRPAAPPDAAAGRLTARVTGLRWRGHAMLLDATVEGEALTLEVAHDAPLPAIGDLVSLGFEAGRARVIPED